MAGTFEMRGYPAAGRAAADAAPTRAPADRLRPSRATETPAVDIAAKALARRTAHRPAAARPARRPRSEILVSWLIALTLLVAIAVGSLLVTHRGGGGDRAVRPLALHSAPLRSATRVASPDAPASRPRDDLADPRTHDDE